MMKTLLTAAILAFTASSAALSQVEGSVPTQALIHEDGKQEATLTAANLTLKVDNRATPISSLNPVVPSGAQIALLIDDGLRSSFGRNLEDLRSFVSGLPAATEVLIGYMQNGRVVVAQPFTADHALAAGKIRVALGLGGVSASPYFCLSDFVKQWPGVPGEGERRSPEALQTLTDDSRTAHKARFVLMLTNGVDPYNGSVSPMNQTSPYVESAIRDAQRAGAAVYSIYYGDSGIRGGAASFSGQSYLAQVADATGGTAYFEGLSNPVSLQPFLGQFTHAISETYVATFPAAGRELVRLQVTTSVRKTKLRHADEVRPGTQLADEDCDLLSAKSQLHSRSDGKR